MSSAKIALPVIICAMTANALAYLTTLDGREPKFWESHAIVLGKVDSVVANSTGQWIHVQLTAVLSTDFLVPTDLPIRYFVGGDSALRNPVDGSTVMLCVHKSENGWDLPTHGIAFFDSGNAIQPVDGLSDPKVKLILERVQRLRSERGKGS